MKDFREAPHSMVVEEDEKVIDLLVRFKHQMKVVNMLRQDGMEFDKAQRVVSQNVKTAQKILNKSNRHWFIFGWILIFSGTVLPIITFLGGRFTIFSAAPLMGGLYCLRLCDKIKY